MSPTDRPSVELIGREFESALDRAIEARSAAALDFLTRLVAAPSLVGQENEAQEVVIAELGRLAFETVRSPIGDDVGDLPGAGVPLLSYAGRYNVHGRRGTGPMLVLFNGHIDVVPVGQVHEWTRPPFEAWEQDGWLVGRGAGDMKGGFAMVTLALDALGHVLPESRTWPLGFASVLEEECTGNGAAASAATGFLATEVVVPEPTGLEVYVGSIGILWVRITLRTTAGHVAHGEPNLVFASIPLLEALQRFDAELNASIEEALSQHPHPYNINVGVVTAGEWASTNPGLVSFTVRIGFPRDISPEQALGRLRERLIAVIAEDPWLREHPPSIEPCGFRAEGFALDEDLPLPQAIIAAHLAAHGSRPRTTVVPGTFDARFYVRQHGVPAVGYGPKSRANHGLDEAVEIASIFAGAKTIARFLVDRYGPDALTS